MNVKSIGYNQKKSGLNGAVFHRDSDKMDEIWRIENHERMPRVAYRYALEKFDKETKNRLMKL